MPPDPANHLELSEADAWIDMYEAAPADYAARHQLGVHGIDSVTVLTCPTIPFGHFNSVFGLGLAEPATEEILDRVLGIFDARGIRSTYIHITPNSGPDQLTQWLASRGLRVRSSWDRIHRGGEPLTAEEAHEPDELRIERVTLATADAWAAYLTAMYGLPTAPWLVAIAERPGWHHYMLRGDSGIAAVRSMYLHPNGVAWLGVEAPVPGIMAPSYDLDRRLCRAIVADGLARGAVHFIADVEAPAPAMDTPAYENFAALGFGKLYARSNYGW
jgi:hypothetical protein